MSEVMMSFPTEVAEYVIAQAKESGQSVGDTLLAMLRNSQRRFGTTMEDWSDESVLSAANMIIPQSSDSRYKELLTVQKARALSADEEAELRNLQSFYEAMNLHRSRGIAEAVRRGLQAPQS